MAHPTITPGNVVHPTPGYALVSGHGFQAGIVQTDTHARTGNPLREGYIVVLWADGRRWMEWGDNLVVMERNPS
ncbi:unnamed protein product [marine sediment metagenome]|uniref:Uncharacterized protein n=1 Tax=marine sediment metagenome TaxID=412755 RepID=X0XTR1_9ZZZZ